MNDTKNEIGEINKQLQKLKQVAKTGPMSNSAQQDIQNALNKMAKELSTKEYANKKRENFKVETVAYLLTRIQKATMQVHELGFDSKPS